MCNFHWMKLDIHKFIVVCVSWSCNHLWVWLSHVLQEYLQFFCEPPVDHIDISSSNIILDEKLVPKVRILSRLLVHESYTSVLNIHPSFFCLHSFRISAVFAQKVRTLKLQHLKGNMGLTCKLSFAFLVLRCRTSEHSTSIWRIATWANYGSIFSKGKCQYS